ncbi:SGNH/GDSL hydrolase family protein [Mesomycoplasma dispar]|uniref:SGNH hydrolase-type esterase domain-containing protein n=1 Tax=Mesomycoplasma dispar TaxID=86660 RepID=A0ABM6PS43_9BACT|nr:SGNH/GDSL hydrolase family protein [Mesomycoplasma dispar]ATP60006.1 hypothetical protein CSW10_03770 [Mesomycoplasma dispar]
MKFNIKEKKIKLISLGLAPITIFPMLIAAGCSIVAQDQSNLLSKVNYLAIGDSVTAGFNQDTYRDFQGKMDKDGNLSGQSYPAFFAHYLQKINKNSLVSYDNLAISGTTTENWLNLINPKKYPKGKVSDNPLVSGYTGNEKFNEINSVFGKFDKDSYPELISKIKNANLLTMSVGANDPFVVITEFTKFFIPGSKDNEELKKLIDAADKSKKEEIIGSYLKSKVNEKIDELKTNLDNLIKELKAINPNLRINLIGYKIPNSTLVRVLQHLLHNELKIELDFIQSSTEKINKIIREVAIKNQENYVDVYDKSLWNENDEKFSATKLDIHPQIQGYKKIAHQLLLKLATNPNEEGDSSVSDLKNSKNFDDIVDGKPTYKQIIDVSSFAKTNKELLNKLNENKNTSEFIDSKSTFDKNQEDAVKNDKVLFTNIIKNFLGSKALGGINIKDLLESHPFAKEFLGNRLKDFEPSGSLLKDLEVIQEKLKSLISKKDVVLADELVKAIVEVLESNGAPGKVEKLNRDVLTRRIFGKLVPLFLGGGGSPTKSRPKINRESLKKLLDRVKNPPAAKPANPTTPKPAKPAATQPGTSGSTSGVSS